MWLTLLFMFTGLAIISWAIRLYAIIGVFYNRKSEYAKWNWLNPPIAWNEADALRILNERGIRYYRLGRKSVIAFAMSCVLMLITMLILSATGT